MKLRILHFQPVFFFKSHFHKVELWHMATYHPGAGCVLCSEGEQSDSCDSIYSGDNLQASELTANQ